MTAATIDTNLINILADRAMLLLDDNSNISRDLNELLSIASTIPEAEAHHYKNEFENFSALRPDDVGESLDRSEALSSAALISGEYFTSPRVVGGENE